MARLSVRCGFGLSPALLRIPASVDVLKEAIFEGPFCEDYVGNFQHVVWERNARSRFSLTHLLSLLTPDLLPWVA